MPKDRQEVLSMLVDHVRGGPFLNFLHTDTKTGA